MDKEPTITKPIDEQVQPEPAAVEKYRQCLVKARVKTEDDLNNMSDKDIKKMYLN